MEWKKGKERDYCHFIKTKMLIYMYILILGDEFQQQPLVLELSLEQSHLFVMKVVYNQTNSQAAGAI